LYVYTLYSVEILLLVLFFFTVPTTTTISTLSLHDALPIFEGRVGVDQDVVVAFLFRHHDAVVGGFYHQLQQLGVDHAREVPGPMSRHSSRPMKNYPRCRSLVESRRGLLVYNS